MHAVIGLSNGGAARAAAALSQLRAHGMGGRATLVTTQEADGASATERALVAAAACAVGEQRRSTGGHALVLLDDLSGMLDVWDAAGEAVARHGPAYTGASERHIERSEQRIFYAAYLQRVAQMDQERGGGSLTLIGSLLQPPPPDADSHATFGTSATGPATTGVNTGPLAPGLGAVREPSSSTTTTTSSSTTTTSSSSASSAPSPSFTLEDFAAHTATERTRIEALLQAHAEPEPEP